MSAITSEADVEQRPFHFRFGPKADIARLRQLLIGNGALAVSGNDGVVDCEIRRGPLASFEFGSVPI